MGKKHFRKHWEKFLAMPKEDLHMFCGALYFFIRNEDAMKNNSHFNMRIDNDKMIFGDKRTITCTKDLQDATLLDRMLMFLCESYEAGFFKNGVTKINNAEEFNTSYYNFCNFYYSHVPDALYIDPQKSFSEEEQAKVIQDYEKAKENLSGFVNPREVVEYLYSNKLGREFLPPSLIVYLNKIKQVNVVEQTKTIPKPRFTSQSVVVTNRSGSRINPEKHERTRKACQQAWEKIQAEKIIDINFDKFCEIASSFLGKGKSLISTVSRVFYKEEIPQEYKAGAGRKSK